MGCARKNLGDARRAAKAMRDKNGELVDLDDSRGGGEPIIDAHHHFWDLDRNYHPWLCDEPPMAGRHGDYRAIRHSYLPDDYRRDWHGLRIVGSVYVEAEWNPLDPLGETAWVESVAEARGLPTVIVAQAWLARPDANAILAAQARHPRMRGVREKPAAASHPERVVPGAPGSMSDPAWQDGYARLETYGFSFDLQVPFWHLHEARTLVERYPSIPLILDHTGLPGDRTAEGLSVWREGMRTLAGAPNVAVKISGLGEPHLPSWSVSVHRDVVLETIDIFGVDRCMFGSNYPVDRLYAPFHTIMSGFLEITRRFPASERRMMFRDNAIRWYRIAPESLVEDRGAG